MKTKYSFLLIPLLIGLFVLSSTAFAQDLFPEEGDMEVLEPEERIEPDDFGVATWAVDFIGAAKCELRGYPQIFQYFSGGYYYRSNNSAPTQWWCPVQLPNGVDIYRVRCYYWDGSTTAEMRHWLER
jgi:hypothetical protein